MTILSPTEWSDFLSQCPDAHILQTTAWGELKSSFGWKAVHLVHPSDGISWGVQILFRHLPLGFSVAYLPKGPLYQDDDANGKPLLPGKNFWEEVDRLCRQNRAVFLKLEPDSWPGAALFPPGENPQGFKKSPQAIQPPRTIVVDLRGSKEDVLARMKQKTRYNIRLSSRKGVTVSASIDVDAFYRLMETTGQRDQFGIHSLAYYLKAFELFNPGGRCILLMAAYEDVPIAGLMAFRSGRRSWYLYGASASEHRERMPTYLLQWEAMKWARAEGCWQYDLYGVPDHDPEYLEGRFGERSDGLWGVYRFKRGFGGKVTRSQGPWDRVYKPFIYQLYLRWAAERTVGD